MRTCSQVVCNMTALHQHHRYHLTLQQTTADALCSRKVLWIFTSTPWRCGALRGGEIRSAREDDRCFQFSGGSCGTRQIRLVLWASQGRATTNGTGGGWEGELESIEGRLQELSQTSVSVQGSSPPTLAREVVPDLTTNRSKTRPYQMQCWWTTQVLSVEGSNLIEIQLYSNLTCQESLTPLFPCIIRKTDNMRGPSGPQSSQSIILCTYIYTNPSLSTDHYIALIQLHF